MTDEVLVTVRKLGKRHRRVLKRIATQALDGVRPLAISPSWRGEVLEDLLSLGMLNRKYHDRYHAQDYLVITSDGLRFLEPELASMYLLKGMG